MSVEKEYLFYMGKVSVTSTRSALLLVRAIRLNAFYLEITSIQHVSIKRMYHQQ